MAKVTYINQHDWMAVRVAFKDGSQANAKWNRDGNETTLTPNDRAKGQLFALIVKEASDKTRDPKTGFLNLGQLAERMKAIGERATSVDAYLDALKTELGVTGEKPAPKNAANAPETTRATLKPSRGGWQLDALFPNGEKLELKIGRSSMGILTDPRIASRETDITKFVFGIKMAGALDDETLAQRLHEAAEGASDIDEWFDASRAAVIGGPRP